MCGAKAIVLLVNCCDAGIASNPMIADCVWSVGRTFVDEDDFQD